MNKKPEIAKSLCVQLIKKAVDNLEKTQIVKGKVTINITARTDDVKAFKELARKEIMALQNLFNRAYKSTGYKATMTLKWL